MKLSTFTGTGLSKLVIGALAAFQMMAAPAAAQLTTTLSHSNAALLITSSSAMGMSANEDKQTVGEQFTASRSEADVHLAWATGSIDNLTHFTVQRSQDGENYEDIAIVFSAEEASTTYKFRDRKPTSSGTLYYRLAQVSRNGEMTYTSIRSVKFTEPHPASTLHISAYPNPVENELQVSIPREWQGKVLRLELIAANGVSVQQQHFSPVGGVTTLHLGTLAKGPYLVRLSSGIASLQQQVIKK